MAGIQSIDPSKITRPDMLFKIILVKQLDLIRNIAVMNPGMFARSVEILDLLMSPYQDKWFKKEVKFEDEKNEDVSKMKDLMLQIDEARAEEEKISLGNSLSNLKANMMFRQLIKLMDRNSLLLEGKATIDFKFAEEEEENFDVEIKEAETISKESEEHQDYDD